MDRGNRINVRTYALGVDEACARRQSSGVACPIVYRPHVRRVQIDA